MPSSLSDEDIILKGKTKECYDLLLKRYLKNFKSIVHDVAITLNQKHYEVDDYFFEFYTCFHKSFVKYDLNKGNFYSFFKTIFKRKVTLKMLSIIKSRDALDHSISLNFQIEEGTSLFDLIENRNADDPVSSFRVNNAKLVLKEAIQDESRRGNARYKALMLRADGLTYKEIAKKLATSISKVRRLVDTNSDLRLKDIKLDLK